MGALTSLPIQLPAAGAEAVSAEAVTLATVHEKITVTSAALHAHLAALNNHLYDIESDTLLKIQFLDLSVDVEAVKRLLDRHLGPLTAPAAPKAAGHYFDCLFNGRAVAEMALDTYNAYVDLTDTSAVPELAALADKLRHGAISLVSHTVTPLTRSNGRLTVDRVAISREMLLSYIEAIQQLCQQSPSDLGSKRAAHVNAARALLVRLASVANTPEPEIRLPAEANKSPDSLLLWINAVCDILCMYLPKALDLDGALDDEDVNMVTEWL